jgi:hypothetical protein
VCDFDKTRAVPRTLDPKVKKKVASAPTKANGIVKTNGDGSRMSVGDIGADGVMKVKYLAVGNTPI